MAQDKNSVLQEKMKKIREDKYVGIKKKKDHKIMCTYTPSYVCTYM